MYNNNNNTNNDSEDGNFVAINKVSAKSDINRIQFIILEVLIPWSNLLTNHTYRLFKWDFSSQIELSRE